MAPFPLRWPRRRLAALLVAFAALAAACSVGGTVVDLTDPDVLVRLDAAPPEDIAWRRTLAGVEVAGAGTQPDADELAVLEAALSEIPPDVVERAGLGTLFRVSATVAGDPPEPTLAFSRGPDVYLLDRTFRTDGRLITRFDLTRVLGHELAHVAQFSGLTADDIAPLLDDGGVSGAADPIATSALVADFASAVGWKQRAGSWSLPDPDRTTAYGATAPDEDLAEVVSLVLVGRPDWVSPDRVAWVEEWLDIDAVALAAGKPYLPPGAAALDSTQPLYDEHAVARYATARVDVESYRLDPAGPGGAVLAADIGAALTARGLPGTLQPVDDDRVARYSGYFLRGDGVALWVELWDFRDAPGYVDPPGYPVLTYVTLW
jgi:hypothetical protein